MSAMYCDDCGHEMQIGDYPYCPHGRGTEHKGFEPHYDEGLGKVVTGWGDINKACRPRWEDGKLIHLQPRDKPEKYYKELIEKRRDRAAK